MWILTFTPRSPSITPRNGGHTSSRHKSSQVYHQVRHIPTSGVSGVDLAVGGAGIAVGSGVKVGSAVVVGVSIGCAVPHALKSSRAIPVSSIELKKRL